MLAECLVEGRLRMMNHNLKFESYEENTYFEADHCVNYNHVHKGILGFLSCEIVNDDYYLCTLCPRLPILFEELVLSFYQFTHYFLH